MFSETCWIDLCLFYLDDILIFSKSVKEHVLHVRTVLQRLMENKLYVKAEKVSLVFLLFHSWGSSLSKAT